MRWKLNTIAASPAECVTERNPCALLQGLTDVVAHTIQSTCLWNARSSHKMRTRRYSLGGASGFSPLVSRHSRVKTRLRKEIRGIKVSPLIRG